MRNDIYNRNEKDPNYTSLQLELDNPLELFKQQIESCLFTPKTAVMGSPGFGASLDEFVWAFNLSAEDLQYAVIEQISNYCTLSSLYAYEVNCQFYAGNVRDIAVINIEIEQSDRFNIIVA